MEHNLASDVYGLSRQRVELCYHCHKCAAGCPVVGAMAYGPDRLLRMAALDQRGQVLASRDIWLCARCCTCAARCPNGIGTTAVMDALRQLAVAGGYPAGECDAALFHSPFLRVVRQLGPVA